MHLSQTAIARERLYTVSEIIELSRPIKPGFLMRRLLAWILIYDPVNVAKTHSSLQQCKQKETVECNKFEAAHECLRVYTPRKYRCNASCEFSVMLSKCHMREKFVLETCQTKPVQNQCFTFRVSTVTFLSHSCVYVSDSFH